MRELIKGGASSQMIIGYSSMMAPTCNKENGKVYKMLRLLSSKAQEGDIHFFINKKDKWILLPDKSFINLQSEFIDFYQYLPRDLEIEFSQFVQIIGTALDS